MQMVGVVGQGALGLRLFPSPSSNLCSLCCLMPKPEPGEAELGSQRSKTDGRAENKSQISREVEKN